MSQQTVTEHSLFKALSEHQSAAGLNCQFVKDAQKLYQLMWSALTKYLVRMIHE
jgi:hypothetical protein